MNEDYVEVVWKIVERSKGTGVSVVLLFCTTEHSYGITRAAQNIGKSMKFTWIASDAWDTTKVHLSNTAVVAVKLGPSTSGF